MRAHRWLVAGAVLVASSTFARADVTAVGEFVGDYSEGFEDLGPPTSYPGGLNVFSKNAVFNDILTDAPWITTNLSGPNGNVPPYDGFLMGLAPTGWVSLDFDAPISRFGAYLGAAFTSDPGSVSFFDEEGGLIETLAMAQPTTTWTWYGWQSTVPIARIEIRAGLNPGTTMVLDNMQMSLVPGPGGIALLACAAWCTRSRKRNPRTV